VTAPPAPSERLQNWHRTWLGMSPPHPQADEALDWAIPESPTARSLQDLEQRYFELRRLRFQERPDGTRIQPSIAAQPAVDLSPRAPRMKRMAAIAREIGVDLPELKDTLRRLGRVRELSHLGNKGPLNASLDRSFNCGFGRDPIQMAIDLFGDFPDVTRATVMWHISRQGQRFSRVKDEQKGRTLHEDRNDRRGKVLEQAGWAFPYYGSIDATPLDVILIGKYVDRYPGSAFYDEEVIMDPRVQPRMSGQTIRESVLFATQWIVSRLDDPRGGGYLFNLPINEMGIKNQVFKDSGKSYPLEPPYAPVEVQAYAYDALITAAEMLERQPASKVTQERERNVARELRARAADLRQRFFRDFAIRDAQGNFVTFDHAIKFEDGVVQHANWVSSNAGRLLDSRILDGDEPQIVEVREKLIERLLAPDMRGPWGIRTLSNLNDAYDPVSYHNGSIWPPDTMAFLRGLMRHGEVKPAIELMEDILRACAQAKKLGHPFPEWLPGELGLALDGKGVEAAPTKRQGWTATAVWACLSFLSQFHALPEPELDPET
jgi:glycogen debranching enzyme